jgi:hypothetical protein
MATDIGTIKTLIGTATASDGSQRTLQAGDRIFQDEVITTGTGYLVQEIELSGVATGGDAAATLQLLLETNVINDGI